MRWEDTRVEEKCGSTYLDVVRVLGLFGLNFMCILPG